MKKAALYCHFASKEDILMVWHMGLYEFGTDARWRVGQPRDEYGDVG